MLSDVTQAYNIMQFIDAYMAYALAALMSITRADDSYCINISTAISITLANIIKCWLDNILCGNEAGKCR